MEIESYEPYHIGVKLSNFVNMRILRMRLKEELEKRKYEILEEKDLFPLPLEKVKEYIAVKKKVKVELNYSVNAVNVILELTRSPREVIVVFNDLLDVLSTFGYDLEKIVLFF
ncbi:MAG TPA: hypothetical protein ENI51_01115 [Candidatus Atribacteria bacterium]|nr:hypothetical protein [Candidatus Atribacteria bacterium]